MDATFEVVPIFCLSIIMQASTAREQTKLWHISTSFGNLKLMRATYVTQSFSRHIHEDFPVGVIECGALGFYYRGENVVAPVGSINLANPGEPHTGHAAIERGWTYRMFYCDLDLLRHVASEIAGKSRDLPFFEKGVIHDDDLAHRIRHLHLTLEQADTPKLEQESRILDMLTQLILRHADDRPVLRSTGEEHQAVRRAREYIEAHYAENISLEQLADVAYLSPFHLVRVFHDEIGLPPHAYLTQVRIRRAKGLLARNYPLTEVAFETGFVDQSHLTKRFKRIVGVTPGQYRKNVQDR
jgi:AraC-like DNA-binding protein